MTHAQDYGHWKRNNANERLQFLPDLPKTGKVDLGSAKTDQYVPPAESLEGVKPKHQKPKLEEILQRKRDLEQSLKGR